MQSVKEENTTAKLLNRFIVANILDITESEFEFKSRYYVHFRTNN